MHRTFSDPRLMLTAIRFIGENQPVDKKTLFSHLLEFTDPDKDGSSLGRSGATKDVLYNLEKVLPLVEADGHGCYSLSATIPGEFGALYSGRQIYDALQSGDHDLAFQRLQTDCLVFYPEMRSLVLYIWKKRQGKSDDLKDVFIGKTVFGVTFNTFTFPATLRFAHMLGLIERDPHQKGVYRAPKLNLPLFAQLVVEEYASGAWPDPSVALASFAEHFFLKYGLKKPQFLESLDAMRLLLPGLIIPGSYNTIAIDLDRARRLNLYE